MFEAKATNYFFIVPMTQNQAPVFLAGGMPAGPGASPQLGFSARGIWLPIVITFPSGCTKST